MSCVLKALEFFGVPEFKNGKPSLVALKPEALHDGGEIKRLCSPSPHCSKQIPTFHLADADDPVGYGQCLQQTIGAQGLIKA